MQPTSDPPPLSVILAAAALSLALLIVDVCTTSVPLLAAYVLIVAIAATRLPYIAAVVFAGLAVAAVVLGPMCRGEDPASSVVLLSVFNRAAVLAAVLFLVHRFQARNLLGGQLDALTGLPNRKVMLQRLEMELNRSRRTGHALTVVFLDGDNFKSINDTHGHLVGDQVLKEAARVLLTSIRDYDMAARWGGDEFVLLYPDTGADQARIATNRLLNRLRTELGSKDRTIGFSAGIVTTACSQEKAEDLIRRADEAMYAAKRSLDSDSSYVILDGKTPIPSPRTTSSDRG